MKNSSFFIKPLVIFSFSLRLLDAHFLDSFTEKSFAYFHAPDAAKSTLLPAICQNSIFEIDLAYAYNNFNNSVFKGLPYIGHPEEFYTKLGRPFPYKNMSFDKFCRFIQKHPSAKILIDLKDEAAFPYLKSLVQQVGSDRCIVHAFIKEWLHPPDDQPPQPHWYRENIRLAPLNSLLEELGVPLIANCNGFSNEHMEKHDLLQKMLRDAKPCKSILALGIYSSVATKLPKKHYLKQINESGYLAWVNGNLPDYREKTQDIDHIAMCDDLSKCSIATRNSRPTSGALDVWQKGDF